MKYSGLMPLSEKIRLDQKPTLSILGIFFETQTNPESILSTTSISGPSKANYFCVICKKEIYLFYNCSIYLFYKVIPCCDLVCFRLKKLFFFATAEVRLKFCQCLAR